MVADRLIEEIVKVVGIQFYPDLRTAEISFVHVLQQFAGTDEHPVHQTAALEDGDRSFFDLSPEGNRQTAFKMGHDLKGSRHADGQRAVSEHHRPVIGIDAAGVGHEDRLAGQFAQNAHGYQSRHIAFTAGIDSFGIQNREGQTAGYPVLQQVKASDGETVKMILYGNSLEGSIQLAASLSLFRIGSLGLDKPGVLIVFLLSLSEFAQHFFH